MMALSHANPGFLNATPAWVPSTSKLLRESPEIALARRNGAIVWNDFQYGREKSPLALIELVPSCEKKWDSQGATANNSYTCEKLVGAKNEYTTWANMGSALKNLNWSEQVVLVTGGTGSFGRKFVEIMLNE